MFYLVNMIQNKKIHSKWSLSNSFTNTISHLSSSGESIDKITMYGILVSILLA